MNPALSELWHAWSLQPSILVGCVGLIIGYLALVAHPLHLEEEAGGQGVDMVAAGCFLGGVNVLLLSLISPLDVLSDRYLFSAHMLQHMLLVMLVPPLLLWGLPAPLVRRLLAFAPLAWLERIVRHPVLAWSASMVTLWVWHLPALYNWALANEPVHAVEHLTFLATAVVFWWPVLAPVEGARLGPMACVTYLFLGAVVSGLLGIVLTFADPSLYPVYTGTVDPLGLLPLLRESWGITPAFDQQMGGLLMWVFGSLVFLLFILRSVIDWYRAGDSAPVLAASRPSGSSPQPQVPIPVEEVVP